MKTKYIGLAMLLLFIGTAMAACVDTSGNDIPTSTEFEQKLTNKQVEGANVISCRIFFVYQDLIQPIASAIALVVLAFGGLKFMTAANDPTAKDQAKQIMMSAIVGLIIVNIAPYVLQAIGLM